MTANNRDNFTTATKNHLAMRAGYRCSMPNCGALTVGPSDESPRSVVNIGVAAHIHAAAPTGRRYDPIMTEEERRDIRNGIWLCSTHSIEIDRDAERYTPDVLRRMKANHERAVALELNAGKGNLLGADLIALGPDIVGLGELIGTAGKTWSIRFDHFVAGSLRTLLTFCEQFQSNDPNNRYVHCQCAWGWPAASQQPNLGTPP